MTEQEIKDFLDGPCPPATDHRWRLHLVVNRAMRRRKEPIALADVARMWDRAMTASEEAKSISPLDWMFKGREAKAKIIARDFADAAPRAGHAVGGRVVRGTRSLGG